MSAAAASLEDLGTPVRVGAVRATRAHADAIARNCREIDRYELWAGFRHTPDHALRYGLEHSSHVWTGMVNMQPFCMFGVVPENVLCGSGTPWLIATDEILEHQVAFLRRSKPMLKRMQVMYSSLSNFVAVENTNAIAWLTWLGFSFEAPQLLGAAMFQRFEWRRDV
jgi:hypothetical protein